jgi:membrane protease YdiL (CAAX protease family)
VHRAVVAAIALALCAALGFVMTRIAALEARELDARGEPVTIADAMAGSPGGHTLVSADLVAGEDGVFELCASDRMGDAWGSGGRVELRVGSDTAVEATLDAETRARARTSASGSCLEVGRGTIQVAGPYALVLRFEGTPPEARVRGRILARRSLGPTERNGVLAVLGLAILLVVALAMRVPSSSARRSPRRPRWARALRVRVARAARRRPHASALGLVALGAGLVVATGLVIPSLLPHGSTYGLLAGLLLAVAEIALALALLGGSLERLALVRPSALWMTALFFVSAPFVGFVLRGFAIWALSNVEATGEAPIEAFVAWPSGLLSFGALAVVAPIAEEVFFRGFVFGAVDDGRWGARRALAFLLAWSLFALAHLQQVWGNWGGLLAVTVAGFVFTTLRAVSGSTLVPTLAHLVYNALLSVSVLTAAIVVSH